MAIIVLHNNDSQGSRAPAAFNAKADVIYRVAFIGNNISPVSMAYIHAIAQAHPGPNIVVWVGHGDENIHHKGHPVTDVKPIRDINSTDLIRAFTILNPNKIYLFSCMAMQWVQREAFTFYNQMMFVNPQVKIFAATTRILGGALGPVAAALASGVENPPGAFGQGHIFESVQIYGETFIEWRQRVSPQRSLGGFWESPI